jgi:hypothetical protein
MEERRRKWLAHYRDHAHQRGGACLSAEYLNAHGHLHWRCAEGHEWRAEANAIRQGEWCPECARVVRPAGKKSRMFARVQAIARRHGGACVSTQYVNSQSHLRWRCADGHEWDAVPGSIAMGTWCPHCAGHAPLTIADMHEMARDRGGQCLSRTYHNTQDPLLWRCAEGHEWSAQPTKLRQGSWCPRCSERARHTIDDVQTMAAEHGGECLSVAIDGSLDPLRFRCRVGHLFESNANRLQQGHWCPRCRQTPRGNFERLQQAVARRGGSLLGDEYQGSLVHVRVRCSAGHEWLSTPQNLISGRWCRECWRASRVGRSTPPLGIADMQEVAEHRGGRCLSDTYVNNATKLRWQCHDGHEWEARPSVVRSGHWCPQCAYRHRGTIDAMRALAAARGGECSSRAYQNHNDPLLFRCVRGHSFSATGMEVKSGVWCPTCGDRDLPTRTNKSPSPVASVHPPGLARVNAVGPSRANTAVAGVSRHRPPPAEITSDYLKLIGINSGTVAAWMRDGVLLATGNPHVFRRTPEATRRIAAKLAR